MRSADHDRVIGAGTAVRPVENTDAAVGGDSQEVGVVPRPGAAVEIRVAEGSGLVRVADDDQLALTNTMALSFA
jgi:hypothetical protein